MLQKGTFYGIKVSLANWR